MKKPDNIHDPAVYRILTEELIPLLREVRDALRETRPPQTPSLFAQPELPGLAQDDTRHDAPDGCEWTMPPAGQIAKSILPRRWCNTVKVWEVIHARFRDGFLLEDLADAGFLAEVSSATNGKVGFASMGKMLSVLRRAGAVERTDDGLYRPLPPRDETRELVERTAAKKRKEAAA